MAASSARRREKDVMALLMSNYDVDLGNAGGDFGVSQPQEPHTNGSGGHNASSSNSSTTNGSGGTGQGHQSSSGSGGVNASGLIEEFTVKFKGPEDTPYEGGLWYVSVRLPQQYPFKSPSIGFRNRMFHPNVDESSGSVCLDVISQTWTPMYDLVNIFEQFLPQLLRYPNPTDPLNGEAAHLLLREPEQYKKKVKDYVIKFASESSLNGSTDTSTHNGADTGPSSPSQKPKGTAETMEDMEMDDDNQSDVSELSDL